MYNAFYHNYNTDSDSKPIRDYNDPSGKIWSIYAKEAKKFDDALVESWKGDMDGILIFVRRIWRNLPSVCFS